MRNSTCLHAVQRRVPIHEALASSAAVAEPPNRANQVRFLNHRALVWTHLLASSTTNLIPCTLLYRKLIRPLRICTKYSLATNNLTTNSVPSSANNYFSLLRIAGAHTIGAGHCNAFGARLGGGGGANSAADPTLNAAYASQLRAACGPAASTNNATAVPMDPGSPARFDAHYYVNLKLGRGLFASDAALLTDRRAAGMIHRLTKQGYFLDEFRNAVRKMGRVGVRTGDRGDIRRNCRAVNK